jgi:gas vesicle protein
MRRLVSYLLGISIGAGVGVLLVTFFSPVSGREVRANLRQHYADSMTAARKAAAAKRAELEKEIETMKQQPSS